MDDLVEMAAEAASLTAPTPARKVHRLYLELASFTSDYLAHQDVEERVVMPALEAAVGVPEVLASTRRSSATSRRRRWPRASP